MALEFNFDNAAFHFDKTEGPKGFILKYLTAYVVVGLIVAGLNILLAIGLFGSLEDMQQVMSGGGGDWLLFLLYQGFAIIIGVLVWVVFEAAVLRRYLRAEGFALKLGADEGRLVLVSLIWMGLGIVAYIALAFVFGLLSVVFIGASPMLGGIIVFLLGLVAVGAWIYYAVRFSAAGALTIRDRAVRFPSAWAVTRGRFWTLFGAYLVLFLIFLAIYVVLFVVLFMFVLGSTVDFSDPEALSRAFMPTNLGLQMVIMTIITTAVQGFVMLAWAGPAALAAKLDPRHGGQADAASVFE